MIVGKVNFLNSEIQTKKSCFAVGFKSNDINLSFFIEGKKVLFEEEVYDYEVKPEFYFSELLFLEKPSQKISIQFEEKNLSGKSLDFYCITNENSQISFWDLFFTKVRSRKISSTETLSAEENFRIIPREEWLYAGKEVREGEKDKNGIDLFWPQEKYPKLMIFVHHTAGSNDPNENAIAVLNGIYDYHARGRIDPLDGSLGWGDIGYNFLIDKKGNIYEGRDGGIWSGGGHVLGFNTRSVGISLLGRYDLDVEPPAEQIASLKKLINYISKETGIDLSSQVIYGGKNFNTISGHRDGQATVCPGDRVYSKLPSIRSESFVSENRARFFGATTLESKRPLPFVPTETKTINLKYKNISNKTWTKGTETEAKLKNLSAELETKYFTGDNFEVLQNETSVPPNEFATFSLSLSAPFRFGKFQIPFKIELANGERIFLDYAEVIEAEVFMPEIALQSVSLSPQKSSYIPNEEVVVNFSYKNVSNYSFGVKGEKVRIGTYSPQDRNSIFYDPTWITINRPAEISEIIYPNQTWNGSFKMKIPAQTGDFVEWFAPLSEQNFWFPESSRFAIGIKVSEILPTEKEGLTTFLYSDKNFANHFATAISKFPDEVWRNSNPPHPAIQNSGFSIKYFGFLKIDEAKDYEIMLESNDKNRLYVDGNKVLDFRNSGEIGSKTKNLYLSSGFHKILIEHSQNYIDGNLSLFLDGLKVSNDKFFSNINLQSGFLKQTFFEGTDFSANFASAMKKDSPNLPKTNFAQHIFARPDEFVMQEIFTYYFSENGEYEVKVLADDNVKLWIDDPLVISSWQGSTGKEIIGKINLSSGFHQVVINYGENFGDSLLSISLKNPSSLSFSGFKKENIFSQSYEFDPIFKNGFEGCFVFASENEDIKNKFNQKISECDEILPNFSENSSVLDMSSGTLGSSEDWTFPRILSEKQNLFGIKAKGVLDFSTIQENPIFSPQNFSISLGSDDGLQLFNGNGKFYDKFFDKGFSSETINFPADNFSSNLQFNYFQGFGDARIFLSLSNSKVYFA